MYDFLPSNHTALSTDKSLQQFLTKDGALYMVLNRPEVYNAFNGELIENILEALEEAAENDSVRLLILTGSGKNFCAGGDINYMRSLGTNSFEENKEDALQMAYLMQALNEFPKPTIARVNGAAYGGGVGLLCCCDMAFGIENTKVCLSEVKIGMVPATIGPHILKAIGTRNAHRLMLTAEVMQGQDAVDHQLLTGLFKEEEFDLQIQSIAKKISQNAPEALNITKALLLNLAYQPINEGVVEYTADVIANVRASEEGKEGLAAFLEKRKPKF
ncbi:MAG: enoyl-CoA hydratase-related protein [Candidatus Arcticimaribacter sp.]